MNKNSKIVSRLWMIIIITLLGCSLFTLPVMGESDGAGDGSGGGKSVPLDLVSSVPSDGEKNVPLTGDIKMSFNKNVIYLLIRDANKKCFSLTAADGSKVPSEVIMADDQLEFEKRRDISLRPLEQLQPGTAYTVKISPQLQAKNGTSLGHEVTINFVTTGTAAQTVKPVPDSDVQKNPANAAAQDVSPSSPASSENKAAADKSMQTNEQKTQPENEPLGQTQEKKPETKQNTADKKTNQTSSPKPITAYVIIGGLILVAGAGYFYIKKRK
ncbi:MAG: Ig-like domain-containing protein [Syntrophomonas sp.]